MTTNTISDAEITLQNTPLTRLYRERAETRKETKEYFLRTRMTESSGVIG